MVLSFVVVLQVHDCKLEEQFLLHHIYDQVHYFGVNFRLLIHLNDRFLLNEVLQRFYRVHHAARLAALDQEPEGFELCVVVDFQYDRLYRVEYLVLGHNLQRTLVLLQVRHSIVQQIDGVLVLLELA